ncbi:tRNA-dihydrouridine synthase B [Methylohalomonas lacus]|uniref:tRNA-dihydrouridine synthase B n=1 Tax=Methylohalomonas lacus TaxID=398773 RepID=A0AAE3HKF4_9GAMM|nr:tRNA dihydrouridine synthase DusB [Methylohalomonas lacus]MCS3903990.1 tRNA-dihydrouridine synthase B [Methylohalomonas lacus]
MHGEPVSLRIGSIRLPNNLILAPMAGVTDRPFRQLCRELGAGMAVSEMVSADPRLRDTRKSRLRRDHTGEPGPRAVQIAGADPAMLADSARFNVDNGAEIIDINMGCPAKKVCNVMAGSALLRDEALVGRILEAVVRAVSVPVTLKIRTGWDKHSINAVTVARMAEASGIQALTVHGRTRACGYRGTAEYVTVGAVKAAVTIPVIANGDIDAPARAAQVLADTGVDGLMIGRGAQGNPWLFRAIREYLATGKQAAGPTDDEVARVLLWHLDNLYEFYGEYTGVRVARKHVAWYCQSHAGDAAMALRAGVNQAESAAVQRRLVADYFAADVAAHSSGNERRQAA